jgi:hypothetical protein
MLDEVGTTACGNLWRPEQKTKGKEEAANNDPDDDMHGRDAVH